MKKNFNILAFVLQKKGSRILFLHWAENNKQATNIAQPSLEYLVGARPLTEFVRRQNIVILHCVNHHN